MLYLLLLKKLIISIFKFGLLVYFLWIIFKIQFKYKNLRKFAGIFFEIKYIFEIIFLKYYLKKHFVFSIDNEKISDTILNYFYNKYKDYKKNESPRKSFESVDNYIKKWFILRNVLLPNTNSLEFNMLDDSTLKVLEINLTEVFHQNKLGGSDDICLKLALNPNIGFIDDLDSIVEGYENYAWSENEINEKYKFLKKSKPKFKLLNGEMDKSLFHYWNDALENIIKIKDKIKSDVEFENLKEDKDNFKKLSSSELKNKYESQKLKDYLVENKKEQADKLQKIITDCCENRSKRSYICFIKILMDNGFFTKEFHCHFDGNATSLVRFFNNSFSTILDPHDVINFFNSFASKKYDLNEHKDYKSFEKILRSQIEF